VIDKNKPVKIFWWGWIIFLVLGNVIWLYLDKNPPAWDQAAHLRSIILVNQWLRGQFWGNGVDLIRSFGGYPPLIYWIGGMWSLVTGIGVAQITFLNTVFLVATIVGVYKLAELLTKDKKVAMLSAVIFSFLPVIGDISRNLLLDLPLLVWVVWGLYFWFKSEDLKNKKYSWGLLAMLVLASLTKINGFLYFGPIFIISLVKNYRSREFWVRIVIGGAVYSLLVSWWWVLNWQNIYSYLTGLAGSGEKLTDPMNLFDWQTWVHYFRLFFLHQAGPIVALIFLFLGKKENKKLIWWTILVYVIFSVIKNKDFRFTLPLLVPVAIWMGWGLRRLNKKWLTVLVLIWMGFNFVENGFNFPIKKPVVINTPTFLLGDVRWINFSDYPVREFKWAEWPNQKILANLPEGNIKLLMLMNVAELNDNTLGLYRLLTDKDNLEIHGVDKWGKMDFDYVLVPDLAIESAPFYDVELAKRKEAIKYVWENIGQYRITGEYQLPGKGKVFLIKFN
jgi:4-amino-4-deoxy-L-arabinose transferase-like glycosyltransferase